MSLTADPSGRPLAIHDDGGPGRAQLLMEVIGPNGVESIAVTTLAKGDEADPELEVLRRHTC